METLDHYKKPYLGSKPTQTTSPGVRRGVQSGFLTDSRVASGFLSDTAAPNQLGIGVFGFFDAKTGLSVVAGDSQVTTGKMLILANSAFHSSDEIGTHGGYKESYKSRGINPRYITGWKKVTCAAPEKAVCHLGNTPFTYNVEIDITSGGSGYANGTYTDVTLESALVLAGMLATVTVAGGIITEVVVTFAGTGYVEGEVLTMGANAPVLTPGTPAVLTVEAYDFCEYVFYCGETYPLQITLGGKAVLSVLNHEVPRTVTAYGGCCPVDTEAPTEIDSTLIMIQWAEKAIESTYHSPFIRPVVYDQNQIPYFATSEEAVAAGYSGTVNVWSNYVSPGYIAGTLAGIRWEGAYVDTKFGNCSFQYSDSVGIVDPVNIVDMSIVTDAGFPCKDTLCFSCETKGFAGQGFGEDVLREFIDDTTRRTTMFAEDQRLREIEGGSDLLASFNRNGLYTRFILQHKIPHNENNNTVFSDANYELNIYIPCNGATTPTVTALETFMTAWLASVDSIVVLETFSHTPFVYEAL